MTSVDRLDAALPELLAGLVAPASPDDLDLILTRSAALQQRSPWSFPERWIPMSVLARTASVTRPIPWRMVGLVALILLAVAAAVVLGPGARQSPAPPFGVAGNGLLVFEQDSKILTIDPGSGSIVAQTGGAVRGQEPTFSRDGTRIAFARPDSGSRAQLIVADANLRDQVVVTPDPLQELRGWSFSPDGRSVVALARVDGVERIVLASADGSQPIRVLDVIPTFGDSPPAFRPPLGNEILFLRQGEAGRAAVAVNVATGAVRTIAEPTPTADIIGAAWSPDGASVVYTTVDGTSTDLSGRAWVVSADGTGARHIDSQPGTNVTGYGPASNDASRIVISRFYPTYARMAIVPLDGSGTGVEIACPPPAAIDACGIDIWGWSPDDSMLLGREVDNDGNPIAAITVDPATGESTVASWSVVSPGNWQRTPLR
jgi:hypothetical protein